MTALQEKKTSEVEETYHLGRPIKGKILIDKGEEDFKSYYAAIHWLKENGFDHGSTCATLPMAITKREYDLPQKWKNMTPQQKRSVDGVMYADRNGKAMIYLF